VTKKKKPEKVFTAFSENTGKCVEALCGNDKGKCFFVLGSEEDFYFLCDGKKRTIEIPKKKRKKHVKEIGFSEDFLMLLVNEKKNDKKEKNKSVEKLLRSLIHK